MPTTTASATTTAHWLLARYRRAVDRLHPGTSRRCTKHSGYTPFVVIPRLMATRGGWRAAVNAIRRPMPTLAWLPSGGRRLWAARRQHAGEAGVTAAMRGHTSRNTHRPATNTRAQRVWVGMGSPSAGHTAKNTARGDSATAQTSGTCDDTGVPGPHPSASSRCTQPPHGTDTSRTHVTYHRRGLRRRTAALASAAHSALSDGAQLRTAALPQAPRQLRSHTTLLMPCVTP